MLGSVRGGTGASWSVKNHLGVCRISIIARDGLEVSRDQKEVAGKFCSVRERQKVHRSICESTKTVREHW